MPPIPRIPAHIIDITNNLKGWEESKFIRELSDYDETEVVADRNTESLTIFFDLNIQNTFVVNIPEDYEGPTNITVELDWPEKSMLRSRIMFRNFTDSKITFQFPDPIGNRSVLANHDKLLESYTIKDILFLDSIDTVPNGGPQPNKAV